MSDTPQLTPEPRPELIPVAEPLETEQLAHEASEAEPEPVTPELPTYVDDPLRYKSAPEATPSLVERSASMTQVNYS